MKISCQNCSSKYTVSDEKVQGKTVKLKCKKCGATILVNSGGATTVANGAGVADHVSASSDVASAEGTSYLVNVAEGDQRTMTVPDLVAAYQAQVVTADTYVWADGMGDWQPLGQVDVIVAALSGGAPAASAHVPSSPPAAMTPAPPASASDMASAASMAASARPAARRETSNRRADVFGSEKQDDIATSAPLFSASARAAASNAAAAARPSQQREENSVLFSLSALTSKGPATAPAPAPSRKDSREDSGLIDLRALAAAAAAPSSGGGAVAASGGMMSHDDGGLFPLGMPANAPAAPPVASSVTVPPPPANKAPMFIGIGALVAALAIVGVFFAMKGGDEKPPPVADTSLAAPPPPPTPTVTAPPVPTTEATVAPTASASASATAVAGKGVKPSGKAGTTTTKPGGATTTPATATTKPAAASKGNCGCGADLMCAMRCSAGGK